MYPRVTHSLASQRGAFTILECCHLISGVLLYLECGRWNIEAISSILRIIFFDWKNDDLKYLKIKS